MTVRAAWLLPNGQTRDDTRLAPLGTMTPTDTLTSRAGVIPGGRPLLATGTGMQVQIGTGRAVVQGTTAQGAYPVAVIAPETLALGDGDAQYARVDTVVVRVRDQLHDTSGQAVATVEAIVGKPAATPTPPVLPPASLPLWDITVPAGTSAGTGGIPWSTALTDRRTYTTAVGGIATGPIDGAYAGQWRDNAGVLERYNGTAWESTLRLGNTGQLQLGDARLYRSAPNTLKTDGGLYIRAHRVHSGEVGRVSVSFASTNSHTRDIAFSAPFTAPPVVFVNINSAANITGGWHVRAFNVTNNGFTLWAFNREAATAWSNVEVIWGAIAA
ncbi:H-type lectin domain-containing protein [Streptomyces sp. NPDC003860]